MITNDGTCTNSAATENFALTNTEKTSLRTAYIAVRNAFNNKQIPDADFDARVLINHVTGKDLLIHKDYLPSAGEVQTLNKLVNRRLDRQPLQYLIGEWDFMDFTLCVGEGVLIPRADTEVVCSTAIDAARRLQIDTAPAQKTLEKNIFLESPQILEKKIAQTAVKPHLQIADLCAGSGAISIAIARKIQGCKVTAVELSDNALFYLGKNVKALAPSVQVLKRDVLTWQDEVLDGFFDVIVSNPPYLSDEDMKELFPELKYEPKMALHAGQSGYEFYEHIAKAYRKKLKNGGSLVFEIGSLQAQKIEQILEQNGYAKIKVINDASGNNRCIHAIAKSRVL